MGGSNALDDSVARSGAATRRRDSRSELTMNPKQMDSLKVLHSRELCAGPEFECKNVELQTDLSFTLSEIFCIFCNKKII